MERKIEKFENSELGVSIRIIDREGEPWFVGNDVARALGYADANHAVRDHCKGGCVLPVPSDGGIQEMKIIPEADLYRLILHSKLPQAEAFQDWVVEVVLPSIRKHGAYMTTSIVKNTLSDPESIYVLAKAYCKECERNEILEDREAVFGNRTHYGSLSHFNGRPRIDPVRGYLRTTKTTIIEEVTEGQRRLFEWS